MLLWEHQHLVTFPSLVLRACVCVCVCVKFFFPALIEPASKTETVRTEIMKQLVEEKEELVFEVAGRAAY